MGVVHEIVMSGVEIHKRYVESRALDGKRWRVQKWRMEKPIGRKGTASDRGGMRERLEGSRRTSRNGSASPAADLVEDDGAIGEMP
jgi:hypothetical protein